MIFMQQVSHKGKRAQCLLQKEAVREDDAKTSLCSDMADGYIRLACMSPVRLMVDSLP
jgi:hypothetical protein